MKTKLIIVAVALSMILIVSAARAQSGGNESLVTGSGLTTIKKRPNIARVHVVLSGEGKSLKEAMAKLKERRESAKKKLLALGVVEGAITCEEIQLENPDQRQQMERMMRMRMRGGNRPTTGPAGAPTVKVNFQLKAEWPLNANSTEEMLLAAHELREKVKAADLADNKMASLEEQESREEAAGESNDGNPAPGEPFFLFVAKISPQERAGAMGEAFNKAKANAASLAKAAGAELGILRQINGQAGIDYEQMQYMENFRRYRGHMNQAASAEIDEATSPMPAMVTMNVTVSASFALK